MFICLINEHKILFKKKGEEKLNSLQPQIPFADVRDTTNV